MRLETRRGAARGSRAGAEEASTTDSRLSRRWTEAGWGWWWQRRRLGGRSQSASAAAGQGGQKTIRLRRSLGRQRRGRTGLRAARYTGGRAAQDGERRQKGQRARAGRCFCRLLLRGGQAARTHWPAPSWAWGGRRSDGAGEPLCTLTHLAVRAGLSCLRLHTR